MSFEGILRGVLPALAVLWLAPASFALVQDEGSGDEESAEVEEVEESDVRWLAVVGGDVMIPGGGELRGATVLARNKKIHAVGYDLDVPEDAKIVDATGLRVYPGLVAISSQGLLGTSSDFEDSIDPFSERLILGLASGITSSGVGSAAVKLKRFTISDVTLKRRTYALLKYDTSDPTSKEKLREKLDAAKKYLREYALWEQKVKQDKELKEPSRKGVDSTVLSVLRGELLAKFKADQRNDLLEIALLAQTYGFRPLIEGCREGWTVAAELGRAGAFAIVTPRERRAKDELLVRPGGSSIENAAKLHSAGVPVAIVPARDAIDLGGIVGRDIMHLPIEAAFAVRGGLPEQAAIDALTIVPARIMGVSHRVGSIEVGKDCDLILTDGDILHYKTFVQTAVVDGKVVYEKDKELFFSHIRPLPERPAEAAPDAAPPEPVEEPEPAEKKED